MRRFVPNLVFAAGLMMLGSAVTELVMAEIRRCADGQSSGGGIFVFLVLASVCYWASMRCLCDVAHSIYRPRR